MAPTSILSRKKDLIYFIFFLAHGAIMFLVDLVPLYPASITPEVANSIRRSYVTSYNDRFFIKPPAWFSFFIWIEAIYHVPVTFWALPALLRDDPRVPLVVMPFALELAFTTLVCMVETLDYAAYSKAEKSALIQVYMPHLVLSVFMCVDMYKRLLRKITSPPIDGTVKKTA